jgi:hypothetical protein
MIYLIEYYRENEVDPCNMSIGCKSIAEAKERAMDVCYASKYARFKITKMSALTDANLITVGTDANLITVGTWAKRWSKIPTD